MKINAEHMALVSLCSAAVFRLEKVTIIFWGLTFILLFISLFFLHLVPFLDQSGLCET